MKVELAQPLYERDGELWMVHEGEQRPIIVHYPEGDVDCVPWPLLRHNVPETYWDEEQDRQCTRIVDKDYTKDLNSALFDLRECGVIDGDSVTLPDGSKFEIN